ncbi:hypothetical protein GWK48_00560 [Metallosphaera tengchongensis]|uniref:Uncharacterized protein n=1 Tax=Metallosphaera tengchongensis TaxID=1532350 RepID=A0A6N0NUD8_9CREN|nr:hypothetical protein [Metallosphaera tengchongensis]QKQ99087.1 hypothetical protein GWK48_00560 [Metallosphaera tengchongensis]
MTEAYVFWHRRSPETSRERYEEGLKKFHEVLRRTGVNGLHFSSSYRVYGIPWMPEGDIYEDWYYISDSSVLDRLIEEVEQRIRVEHDEIASMSMEGKGTLLQLKGGDVKVTSRDEVTWFSKPRGVRYEDFYSRLGIKDQSLWRRLLAMGPSPEFCLIGKDRVYRENAVYVSREMIYTSKPLD